MCTGQFTDDFLPLPCVQDNSLVNFWPYTCTGQFSGELLPKRGDNQVIYRINIQRWTFVSQSILLQWTFFPSSNNLKPLEPIGGHTCFECEHTISEQSKDTNFWPFFSVFCILDLRMLSYKLQGASQSVPLCCVKREISLWHVCICTSVEHWASLAQQVKAWLYYNNYIYYDIDSTLLAMMYSTWIY